MKSKVWVFWLVLGLFFLLNAIAGRYLVLPGYLSNLEAGRATIETAREAVPAWKIIRYLLWAYSFKLGVFFVGISALMRTSIRATRLRVFFGGGIGYLLLCYVTVPGPYPLFFGIGGSVIAVLVVLVFMAWSRDGDRPEGVEKASRDYRLVGYFFFAMATYNLCPLLGVKTFGLYPEKMIRYDLQTEAASFAARVMIELTLGWLFIFLSHRKGRGRPDASR